MHRIRLKTILFNLHRTNIQLIKSLFLPIIHRWPMLTKVIDWCSPFVVTPYRIYIYLFGFESSVEFLLLGAVDDAPKTELDKGQQLLLLTWNGSLDLRMMPWLLMSLNFLLEHVEFDKTPWLYRMLAKFCTPWLLCPQNSGCIGSLTKF